MAIKIMIIEIETGVIMMVDGISRVQMGGGGIRGFIKWLRGGWFWADCHSANRRYYCLLFSRLFSGNL